MYERHIVIPPSGPGPGVLQTQKLKGKKPNQGYNTIIPLTEKRQTNYSIILSKEKALGSYSLLRCADKHSFCENQKTKGQKQNPKTLRASQLFTVCDTSALACWQYTPDEIVLVCLFKCISLLRCAYKHKNIEILKTKDKGVRVNSPSPFECSRLLASSLRVPLLYCIGACFAAHRNTKSLSSKAQTHKRQNPVKTKYRGRIKPYSASHLVWF